MNFGNESLFCRPVDERALIHFCMKDITNYYTVCSRLTPSDFLYPQHEMTMLLFESLAAKNAKTFDSNVIIAEATANGIMENIGGLKYIQAISSMDVASSNLDLYIDSVVEASTKLKLYNLLTEGNSLIEQNAKDGLTSADLLSKVESSILDLSMAGLNIREPINLHDGLAEYIEERRLNRVELSGISTGYPILDKQIDGLVPGTLFVLAARKKMGKSTVLSNIAIHIAYRLQIPTLYVDTELTFPEWRSRAISTISGVKERDIKHGGFDDITYQRLMKTERFVSKGKLFHEYMPGYSVDKLVALYKKYQHKEKIGFIVFDYLKEPDSSSVERQRKEYQILGDVTTKLKDLAGGLNVPALTAVQLNRDDDVADSDRIARYADVVAFWQAREKKEIDDGGYESGTHKIVIKDTRRGGATSETGIGYMFFKEFLQVKEVPADRQYFNNFEKVVNNDSASMEEDLYDGYKNEDL